MATGCSSCEVKFSQFPLERVSPVSHATSPVCRFELDGVQTVRTIQATHERLVAAMAAHQAIEIDCNAVAELDLSLIQLVLAAKRSADKADKSLTLAAPASGKLRAALDRAGFLAAAVRGPGEAFWLKGAKAP